MEEKKTLTTEEDYDNFVEYFFSIKENKDWVLNKWFKFWLKEYKKNRSLMYLNYSEEERALLEKERHIKLDDEEIKKFYDEFTFVNSKSYIPNPLERDYNLRMFMYENRTKCRNDNLPSYDSKDLIKEKFNSFFECLTNPKYEFADANKWILDKFKDMIINIIENKRNVYPRAPADKIIGSFEERDVYPRAPANKIIDSFKRNNNIPSSQGNSYLSINNDTDANADPNNADANDYDVAVSKWVPGQKGDPETDGGGGSPHIYESIKTPSFVRSAKRDKSGPYNRFHYIKVRPAPPPPLPPPRKTKKLNKII